MGRLYNILSFVLLFACCGCMEEMLAPEDMTGSALKDGCLVVDFSGRIYDDIVFTTKSTVPTAAEDAIINVYAMVFNSAGKKVYGHHFFYDTRKASEAEVTAAAENCWYVDNKDSGAEPSDDKYGQTRGRIKMKLPDGVNSSATYGIDNGSSLYLIANLDAAVINISKEKLDNIHDRETLVNTILTYNQESTYRTGNLLMVGECGINVYGNRTVSFDKTNISLERIDAKVKVMVGIVPGLYLKKGGETADKSDDIYEELESFVPKSWQVVNLPKKSNFLYDSAKEAVGQIEDDYFNSEEHLFETKDPKEYTISGNYSYNQVTNVYTPVSGSTAVPRTLHGFSFYMFENHQSDYKKGSVTDAVKAGRKYAGQNAYHLRDKLNKDENASSPTVGQYTEGWEFAPDYATYLILKGEVRVKVNEQAVIDGKSQTLNANVVYYIHLGNLDTGGLDNYDVDRNSCYTYTINIKGVDKIELEVTSDASGWDIGNEQQSGAMGEVYIAQEEIYTFDAHYGQRVFTFGFDAILKTLKKELDADNNGVVTDEERQDVLDAVNKELTWAVYTPFGRQGTPDRTPTGVDIPNGLDYKWVYFLVNETENVVEGGVRKTYYSKNNQWYPGYQHKGKIITGKPENNKEAEGKTFMDVIQLCVYLREQIYNKVMGLDNDFDDTGENGIIRVTAFVDENYYEIDPISEQTRTNLWHSFVNQDMRMMHILCSASTSLDGDSSATGSVVTIRQRSIQTVYNTETADEGWGCETIDEIMASGKDVPAHGIYGRRSLGFFDDESTAPLTPDNNLGNNSKYNGLYNTAKLWGIGNGTKNWSTFLDYIRPNDYDTTTSEGDVIINFLEDGVDEKGNSYMNLRYSCMMRNRDEDGDDIIDDDEIKWYLASTEQLITLFIGDLGLMGEAQLYNIENPVASVLDEYLDKGTYYKSHVVSSTANSKGGSAPQIVWAEEGCSISSYPDPYSTHSIDKDGAGNTISGGYKAEVHSIRCVRNLGMTDDLNIESRYPEPPISYTVSSDGLSYRFDMSKLNRESKRIAVTEELIPQDEYADMARVYNGFETHPDAPTVQINTGQYESRIYDYFMEGNTYCPVGYRLPNIREAAIMQNYIPAGDVNFWCENWFAVVSYFRFGPMELNYRYLGDGTSGGRTWSFSNSLITVGDHDAHVRCIRDIDP